MVWVWVNQYWDDMDQILQRLVGLRKFIAEVEADTCFLGHAVHRYLELRISAKSRRNIKAEIDSLKAN